MGTMNAGGLIWVDLQEGHFPGEDALGEKVNSQSAQFAGLVIRASPRLLSVRAMCFRSLTTVVSWMPRSLDISRAVSATSVEARRSMMRVLLDICWTTQ